MKTVLITGVSKGIGQALMEKFLKEGFDVIGTIYGGIVPGARERLSLFDLDVSAPQSIASCAEKILSTGKKIDILINNAGVLIDEEETAVVVDKLRRTLEVNLIGLIDFTERLIPAVATGGHLINISSTAGSLELTGTAESHFPNHYPCYKISKTALNMYTRTLAFRLKKDDITVSSVNPGWVKTDMGGDEADLTPDEAADGIYSIAVSKPETGGFWFKDERLPW